MSKLPVVTSTQMVRLVRHLGFQIVRQRGSHAYYRHVDGRATVVPIHRGGDLGRGLIRTMLRDIEISPKAQLSTIFAGIILWISRTKGELVPTQMKSTTLKYLLTILAFAAAGGLSLWFPLTLIPHISSDKILSYGLSQSLALVLSAAVLFLCNNVISKRSLAAIGVRCDWVRVRMALWGGLMGCGLISFSFVLMAWFGAIKATYVSPPLNALKLLPVLMCIQGLQYSAPLLVIFIAAGGMIFAYKWNMHEAAAFGRNGALPTFNDEGPARNH